ncbi:MAG: hypothetical protein AB8H47_18435 [Bacteroidia bacterium]
MQQTTKTFKLMKTKLFFNSAFFALIMCFVLQSQAQKTAALEESKSVFNQPLELKTGKNLSKGALADGEMQFKAGSTLTIINVSEAKKFKLPRTVKVLPKPTILLQGNSCFQFSCDPACGSCVLLWLDQNRDGKVQALQEIRCLNRSYKNLGQSGIVTVKKVSCK